MKRKLENLMLNTEALSHDVRAEKFGRGKFYCGFSDLKKKKIKI